MKTPAISFKIKAVKSKISKSTESFKKYFNEREQLILTNRKVSAKTDAVEKLWKAHNTSGQELAAKLEDARRAMVSAVKNSPKSLFSKWLRFAGIPRATAYWTLKRYGKGKGGTTPRIKQLLRDHKRLTAKLAATEAKLKAEHGKDRKKELAAEVKDTQEKISTKSKQIKTQRESLEDQIESAFKNVREKVGRIAWFSDHIDDQAPLLKTVASETQSMVEDLKELDLDWKQSGDLLVKVLSAISTGRDPFDVVRPMLGKKPAASIRPAAHQPAAHS